ncbi:hypothetical protein K2X89_14690 [Myxococcota bacterium]|nr:hypothetical protein [Myxococcota bacterium]
MTTHDRSRAMDANARRDRDSDGCAVAMRTGSSGSTSLARVIALGLASLVLGCGSSDSGGMSGTGISQGSISSFGSIFVNGVEWDISRATIELDGVRRSESDLRVGMVVRVDGNYSNDGLSGDADRVTFDDSIEGPIAGTPIETTPGLEKSFVVLGTTVFARSDQTAFDDGATYAGLAADVVVEVSGFVDAAGAIHATRIQRKGVLPTVDTVELRGTVSESVRNQDGSGIFNLGTIFVRYTSSTTFKDLTRSELSDGDLVEIKATIRDADELDATRIEAESEGFGSGDLDDAKVEGIVVLCPESPDYCINGVPINDDGASFEPMGYTPMPGDLCEAEGSLVAGVLVATKVESEESGNSMRDVRIEAAATSVNGAARTLVILGVTVSADGNTRLEDKSDLDDENLSFSELQAGQYLQIEAVSTGTNTARALSIERDDATPGDDDVRFEGPVTALDPNAPSLSILGQSIPLDGGTEYRDESDQSRTEEEFFRNPGDVALGDVVRARDQDAANLSALAEADQVELEYSTQN